MNYDVQTYEFDDPDLKIAVGNLPKRDQNIFILYMMGYRHREIGIYYNVSRSMITKRLRVIIKNLAQQLL